jgi:hypothetical protein
MSQRNVLWTFLIWAVPVSATIVVLLAGSMAVVQFATTSPRFGIQKIEVITEGPARVDDLIGLAVIAPGTNLFKLNLLTVQEKVETHPWVASASISRALPDRILIRYVPQIPVAIINFRGLRYVNAAGKMFAPVKPGDSLQYPLLQAESKAGSSEISPEQIMPALEILELLEKDTLLTTEDISEITIKSAQDHGGVAISLLGQFPPKALAAKYTQKGRLMAIHFGEDDPAPQLKRANSVISYMAQAAMTPKSIRLELGKKVVVKINQ